MYIYATDSVSDARGDVDYKLRQRLDFRKITGCDNFPAEITSDGKYINKPDRSTPLKAFKGSSYKWGDRGAEFR